MKRAELRSLLTGIETLDWCSDDHPQAYEVLSALAPTAYAALWAVLVAEVFKPAGPQIVKSLSAGRVYLMTGAKVAVHFTGIHRAMVSTSIDLIYAQWRAYWGRKSPALQVFVDHLPGLTP